MTTDRSVAERRERVDAAQDSEEASEVHEACAERVALVRLGLELLVEGAWGILRYEREETRALRDWALRIAMRRGKHRGGRPCAKARGHSVCDVARRHDVWAAHDNDAGTGCVNTLLGGTINDQDSRAWTFLI